MTKRTLRSSSDVRYGVGLARALFPRFRCVRRRVKLFFSTKRKSYFLIVISSNSVDYVNQFYDSINTQFYLFMSVPLKVKLVIRKCLFETISKDEF